MNRVYFLILIGIILSLKAMSQSDYTPPKPNGVDDETYRNGILMLQNAYGQMKRDDKKIFAHDYWNISASYLKMGYPKDTIYHYLLLAKQTNEADFCMIAKANNDHFGGLENSRIYWVVGDSYKKLMEGCESLPNKDIKINPSEYALENKYDLNLVVKLDSIRALDQKYRNGGYNSTLQNPIDEKNILEVETIIKKYGYPGTSLVGKEYESVAWLVIQHSDLVYQEKYLPLINDAVKSKELPEATLKMLIDRVYTKKTGCQIFGSQNGVKFADEKTIDKVKKEYNID